MVAVGGGTRGWAWLCRRYRWGEWDVREEGREGLRTVGFVWGRRGVSVYEISMGFIFSFDPLNSIKVVSS